MDRERRRKPGTPWGCVAVGGAAIAMAVLAITMTPLGGEDFKDDAVKMIAGCPLAVEALGTPATRAPFGWQVESGRRSGDFKWNETSVPVEGPKGSGSIDIAALSPRSGGAWMLRDVVLETGGKRIDLRHCGTPSPLRLSGPRTFSGKVVEAKGAAPAAVGEACAVTVVPTTTNFPCKATIACGSRAPVEERYVPCRHLVSGPETSVLVGKTTDLAGARDETTIDLDERTRRVAYAGPKGAWSFAVAW